MINEQEIQGIKEDMIKSDLRLKAIDRVQSSLLKPYKDILIEVDWPNYDEHIKWVVEAPFSEVLSWCKMIKILDEN